jgi:4,5-DOPA dioxygenase extradiol
MDHFRYPSIFVSHGTPMLAFGDDPQVSAVCKYLQSMPKPKTIIILSAHSVSNDQIHVSAAANLQAVYDFSGFPKSLYEIKYNPFGHPALAQQIAYEFNQSGFTVVNDQSSTIDHGIWIPLMHAYPKADVPIVRVSLPISFAPAQILKMGKILAHHREQGIMIFGSGGAVHNLHMLNWAGKSSAGFEWAKQFETVLIEKLQAGDVQSLVLPEDALPDFIQSHPTSEHYLPILFTVGAALKDDRFHLIHQGIEYGSISMLCFALNKVSSNHNHFN